MVSGFRWSRLGNISLLLYNYLESINSNDVKAGGVSVYRIFKRGGNQIMACILGRDKNKVIDNDTTVDIVNSLLSQVSESVKEVYVLYGYKGLKGKMISRVNEDGEITITIY